MNMLTNIKFNDITFYSNIKEYITADKIYGYKLKTHSWYNKEDVAYSLKAYDDIINKNLYVNNLKDINKDLFMSKNLLSPEEYISKNMQLPLTDKEIEILLKICNYDFVDYKYYYKNNKIRVNFYLAILNGILLFRKAKNYIRPLIRFDFKR